MLRTVRVGDLSVCTSPEHHRTGCPLSLTGLSTLKEVNILRVYTGAPVQLMVKRQREPRVHWFADAW